MGGDIFSHGERFGEYWNPDTSENDELSLVTCWWPQTPVCKGPPLFNFEGPAA